MAELLCKLVRQMSIGWVLEGGEGREGREEGVAKELEVGQGQGVAGRMGGLGGKVELVGRKVRDTMVTGYGEVKVAADLKGL